MERRQSLLGVGIYSVPEAARITGVSAPRIRRWVRGYQFYSGDVPHESPPVWKPDLPILDQTIALSFRDLIEVRFVDYFIGKGVTWKLLREAARYAANEVGNSHPFSTKQFRTDGRRIFRDFADSGKPRALLDIVAKQFAFRSIIEPRLYAGLDFQGDHPIRWFPLSRSRRVVVDPGISFGQPTTHPEGVPTRALAGSFRAEKSIERVAQWFQVDKRSVRDAVEYERQLAA